SLALAAGPPCGCAPGTGRLGPGARPSLSTNCRNTGAKSARIRNGLAGIVASEGGGESDPTRVGVCSAPDLELAQDVVEARLEIRLCAPPADHERAGDLK